MIIMKSGSFTVCHEVLDLVLLGFTEVSLGLYGFYWVLHVFFWLSLNLIVFYRV